MSENLFSTLGKYKPQENFISEENYSTEIFVYLLNYSLKRGTNLFSHFMDKLGEPINSDDYSNITIATQYPFPIGSAWAFPDITIETKNNYYLIEV